jgi:hypothetical protein
VPPMSRGFRHLTYAVESPLAIWGGGKLSELSKSYTGVESEEKIAAMVTKTL